MNSVKRDDKSRSGFLRRHEQGFLAAIVACGLIGIGIEGCLRAWHRNDLIEFDAAPPLKATFQVDMNTAAWPEIVQLPGIGETTARHIVNARDTGGPFTSLEDLAQRVHGVGPRMIAEMEPFVVPISHHTSPVNSAAITSVDGS